MSNPIHPQPGGPAPTGSGQPNGTLILVLGILSIVCLQILGPVAWVMGNNALALINSGQGDPSQAANVNAGRICGIIGTVLLILWILWVVFMGGLGILLHHTSNAPYTTTPVPTTNP